MYVIMEVSWQTRVLSLESDSCQLESNTLSYRQPGALADHKAWKTTSASVFKQTAYLPTDSHLPQYHQGPTIHTATTPIEANALPPSQTGTVSTV